MVLTALKKGELAKITKINSNSIFYNRLVSMGIVEGSLISVISTRKSGHILFELSGKTFALGKEMAKLIEVELNG